MSERKTVTLYELIFTGTVGKQRKARRHVFAVSALSVTDTDHTDTVLRDVAVSTLRKNGAKAGKWALQSYQAEEVTFTDKVVLHIRPIFDASIKNLAIGAL